eukprot:CAMPEP_0175032460 /NCGR_PEP_ID=MMETSP0005-20121125/21429_1 /TAXON_ID=420556 /ORGANISM="Ochromonas sp., Strain CCMP1393" /LENGTH=33 /DNA_ID= /DNA_START= /DNA_END= /DNA_ORIENTATION=
MIANNTRNKRPEKSSLAESPNRRSTTSVKDTAR